MGLTRLEKKQRIKRRVRSVVTGTSARPRLSVYRSNKEIYAQLINDTTGQTIVSASSRDKYLSVKGTPSEVANEVGKIIGKKAIDVGVKEICFDRGVVLYHGRVKSLAEGARESGLKF